MSKKKWLLVVVIILAIVAWYFLFYKTYSKTSIPKSADMVLSVDVKKNTNTLLAYYITTPSEWDLASIFRSRKKKKENWRSAIEIPDYIFVFHCKDQPAAAFYSLLNIKDEEAFNKALVENDFTKQIEQTAYPEYSSTKLGIDVIRNGDKLLIGNIAVKDKNFIRATANEIFQKKEYINTTALENIVKPYNHFTFWLNNDQLLQQPIIFNGNFKNGSLTIDAAIQTDKKYSLSENAFAFNNGSIVSLGFIQPPANLYTSINDNVRSKISTALNFNIDSLFLQNNKNYTLDITEIKDKIDSAISYTYDDDFNKIEKVVVNNIQEPSFSFKINGNNFDALVDHWKKNKKIEETENGNLFTPIPFVKSYVQNKKDSLTIASYNYTDQKNDGQLNCISHLSINPTQIPANLINYLPDNFAALINKIEFLNIVAKKDNDKINLNIIINSKVKNKPFLLSFK